MCGFVAGLRTLDVTMHTRQQHLSSGVIVSERCDDVDRELDTEAGVDGVSDSIVTGP